jgi:hypothetical protein
VSERSGDGCPALVAIADDEGRAIVAATLRTLAAPS